MAIFFSSLMLFAHVNVVPSLSWSLHMSSACLRDLPRTRGLARTRESFEQIKSPGSGFLKERVSRFGASAS